MDPDRADRLSLRRLRQRIPDRASPYGSRPPFSRAAASPPSPTRTFEVSSTLGAGSLYRIVKVGIPAAMPPYVPRPVQRHLLVVHHARDRRKCSARSTASAGTSTGRREMMAYANVYAGLIIIAVTFFILITLLFKFRDHVLHGRKELSNGRKYLHFGRLKHFINPTGERITALDNVARNPLRLVRVAHRPVRLRQIYAPTSISGLIQMDEGELTLDGVPVTAPRRRPRLHVPGARCSRGCRSTTISPSRPRHLQAGKGPRR